MAEIGEYIENKKNEEGVVEAKLQAMQAMIAKLTEDVTAMQVDQSDIEDALAELAEIVS